MRTIMINQVNGVTMKKILIITLLLLATILLNAQDNNSAAAYIRMGIGARIIAMGEAGAATTTGITSAHWNPAGLYNMKGMEFSTMYNMNMGLDRSYKYAAFGKRYEFGTIALSWVNASVDDFEGFTEANQPTGFFNDNEHNISLSYAGEMKHIQYGITPKIYMSKLGDDTKSGFGLDLGLKYDINQYLVAGIMMRDAYGTLDGDKIPYEFSAGVAVYPFLGITLGADVKMEQDMDPKVIFGAEYWTSIGKDNEANSQLSVISVNEHNTWQDILANSQTGLRVGFNDGRVSVGTGIKLHNLEIDYAYRINNHDIFNDDHVISLVLRF